MKVVSRSVAVALFFPFAAVAGPTVYGLRLGEPIGQLPECPFSWNSYFKDYKAATVPCLRAIAGVKDEPLDAQRDLAQIYFVPDDWPEDAKGPIDPTVVDGRLELIRVTTFGVQSQTDVYAHLVQKFGKPAARELHDMQNGFGVHYKVITARWLGKGVRVDFWGALSVDEGRILIGTPAGFREYEAQNTLPKGRPL